MYNAVIDDIGLCYGCGSCADKCPKGCFEIDTDSLGFNRVSIKKPSECIDCGLCSKVCPRLQKVSQEQNKSSRFYAQNKDKDILSKSSSGGVFSALASVVFEQNGCVWGVAMNSDGTTEFRCARDNEELSALRGSKYVEVSKTIPFSEIKESINEFPVVLFSGTPCQVKALYLNLNERERQKLILVDLLCYGIQSPIMWNKYLNEINPCQKPISSIMMRKKAPSWELYSMEIRFGDGLLYQKSRWKDPYLLSYTTNLYNRETCSNCEAKVFPRISDMTIGDFWQIDALKKIPTDMNIKNGVSIILAHNIRGENLILKAKKYLIMHELEQDELVNLDKRFSTISKKNSERTDFIKEVEVGGFTPAVLKRRQKILKKYLRFRWLSLKRIIRKLSKK